MILSELILECVFPCRLEVALEFILENGLGTLRLEGFCDAMHCLGICVFLLCPDEAEIAVVAVFRFFKDSFLVRVDACVQGEVSVDDGCCHVRKKGNGIGSVDLLQLNGNVVLFNVLLFRIVSCIIGNLNNARRFKKLQRPAFISATDSMMASAMYLSWAFVSP